MGTVDKAPCEVRRFEAAVKQLTAGGLADPEKIRIIGFSRTCYYVMEALTTNADPLKAAWVNAAKADGILFMWLAYAGLHDLKKPADLIVLNTEQHAFTNPGVRLASQGGSVDWFRFWLQGYEDPDPAKAAQYKRRGELRKLQEKSEEDRKPEKEFCSNPRLAAALIAPAAPNP